MNKDLSFDLVGVGLNSTDTVISVPHYPPCAGKARFETEIVSPGGQVAGALVTGASLGLRVKYIGTVGDDEQGRIQLASLGAAGIDIQDVEIRSGCPNQTAYIVVDQSTGERTVFWNRPACLSLDPESITLGKIAGARMLHIDGHDTKAVAKAAQLARTRGIPVSADVDTIYDGFDRVLAAVDYLIASSEFPKDWTGENDPFRALERLQLEYKMTMAAMTLGADGALARAGGRFLYSPGFMVNCVDTTGAGDVFHGAFCYAVLGEMRIFEALEFANAMAALNCTELGARGGIATWDEVQALRKCGERRANTDFAISRHMVDQ